MDADLINEKIAKAYGWKLVIPSQGAYFAYYECGHRVIDSPPNYYKDLNAMYEAEKFLLDNPDDMVWSQYTDYLMHLVVVNLGGYQAADLFCHAPAHLRAEAFVKTLKL